MFPKAQLIFASTAGEISGRRVLNGFIVATAIQLEKTKVKCVSLDYNKYTSSEDCGAEISQMLKGDKLCHIFVLSDGISVNGDDLVKGLRENASAETVITGGLAGDMGRFSATLVGLNEVPTQNKIVAVGFYGDNFKVNYGSKGGWDEFGPSRTVTKSKGNVLYELDDQPALDLYKKYLGSKAADLPSSALLFPLKVQINLGEEPLVRTILAIDESNGSMTFAGDIPQGSNVKFMMADYDHLIDGAARAAEKSGKQSEISPELVIMVSCVGRKLVLGDRVDEEVEAVADRLGKEAIYTGFYSNGEISPLVSKSDCRLHNQTMTITAYAEF
jgi:hypothetical protein